MRIEHQIRAFEQIFKNYDGLLPLHRFLFIYFKQNKKMGSSDRRWSSRYIYSFFRLGKALIKEQQVVRLAVADFLCNTTPSLVVETHLPALAAQMEQPVKTKLELVQQAFADFKLADVFSFHQNLSAAVEKEDFFVSFFTQPDLFLRITTGHLKPLLEALKEHEVPVQELSETTLVLPNGTKLENVFPNQKFYQVQDLSSQKTGMFFEPKTWDYWWDCCAASGGKSLLLHDLEPSVQLLVSDVRENSLNNLDDRFHEAGIKKYQKKVLDLLQNNDPDLHHYEFDGIILDAPCSGSGTWGRTPEMLYFFDEHKISHYTRLQKAIATNVVKYLKPGKPLIYITCSVFKQENEEVVGYLEENLSLKLEKMEVIKGYQDKADTMFVARLIKV
ncbi:16S rRNA (cytosine967-C5)-methyltransferase [Pedobacter steynii]|uniref:16S rRNA (Cytosine967-C5)-methyltransferase n=1 Tax=Pedobacter steynii TaxID=430522 RepID=A0A1H0I9T4_9SPHI|nr:RNA methyltransferase [Pedobacter steynii]NQX42837.1 RsmB/NOP family class I SAM-dependent RNA methyltransferase [Pedobacter steynii]SDO28020.1 16S rRNA (cytosine967-C5)-methyltransferase [Pedobacter steynii]